MLKLGGKPITRLKPTVNLFPHQLDGIKAIARAGSMLLTDEMGLGKSLQGLVVGALDIERGITQRMLVVTLATLKGNWAEEIEAHTTLSYEVLPNGGPRARSKALDAFSSEVLIVNYEQVVSEWERLNEMSFGVVIYDEAHAIKNRSSKRTKACLKLNALRHIPMTGSPLLNQVDDLWTLLHRVSPEDWPNYWKFRNRYCVFGGWMGKQIVGIKNEAELYRKLGRFMLRRTKAEVLDLPEKQFIKTYVDLSPLQRRLYDEAREEMQITVPADPDPMIINNELVKFLRLKEVCGSAATIVGYQDESTKLDRVVELVMEMIENGEPVVIFTQFRKIQELINERLAKITHCYQLNGSVPIPERQGVIRAWREEDEASVLLCMFQVAGVGLNLTHASKIILVDKLFVPKLNEQAIDRVHRIGVDETKPVQVYELICRKTVEQRVERILERKEKVFNAVVEGDDIDWKKELIIAEMEDE